jgi:outer membrane cobalamin receptor
MVRLCIPRPSRRSFLVRSAAVFRAAGVHRALERAARAGGAAVAVGAVSRAMGFAPADAAPLAAAPATLRGTVTDPDGRLVPYAGVIVSSGTRTVVVTETDARGSFVVAELPPGRYTVEATHPGFRSDPVRVELADGASHEVTIVLAVAALSESVVVSAAQVDLPRSRVPASTTVLTADALAVRQVESVGDALATVAGLGVVRSGGRGALTSVFPRGGESDYTLVLVDGVPMNAFGGGFDFASLPVADIERVEVVRGPQSAVYGGGAIGAVVHVITRHGGPPRLEGSVEAGGFGTTRLSLAATGRRGPWGWGAIAERLASEGFTGRAPATGERVSNDDYAARHVTLSGSWTGPRRATLRSDVRLERTERGFPGPFGSNPAGLFSQVDRISRGTHTTRTVSVNGAVDWTPALRPAAHVSYAAFEGAFTSPYGASRSATRRLTARVQVDGRAPADLGWSAGVEVLAERGESSYITGVTFAPVPVRRHVTGPFAEIRVERGARLLLVGGLRVERIRREALEADPNPFAPRPPFGPDTRVAPTPRVGAAWVLQPIERRSRGWTKLHASAALGIRPPDAFEIAFTDNPGLKPERSRTVEAGVEQALAGGRLVVDATVFANRYDDLIVAVGRSLRDASRFRTDNISNARARGLELQAAARPHASVHVEVAYTWLGTEILAVDGLPGQAPPPIAPGDPLLRRPRHRVSVVATLERGRGSAFVRLGGRSRMRDVEPTLGAFGGLFDAPGYVVTDVGGRWRLLRGVTLVGRVSNLFDRGYEEALGYPGLPRSAMIGVRVARRD